MKENPKHGDIEVRDALRWISLILDWSQIPFMVLGDLVEYMIHDKPAEVEYIEIGVLKNAWNETTKRLVRTFLMETPFKDIDLENGMEVESNGVPIKVKIIKRKYEFFQNPDTTYYWTDTYKIPNPWAKYMKARYIVR